MAVRQLSKAAAPRAIWQLTGGSARAIGKLASTACDFLLVGRPVPILLLVSLTASAAYCLWLFDLGFLAGTSPAWDNPRGIVGRGWMDLSTSLSGYLYFVRDNWHLPLFHVTRLGAPDGINIIFTDSVPIVALAGRVLYRATGFEANLMGGWTAFCFMGSAVSLTGLIILMGQRGIAAALAATVLALCMPALLARWGHIALMAQFEVVLALIFYVVCKRNWRPLRCFVWASALCVLALWTQPYLFLMVAGLVVAGIGQALFDRTLKLWPGMGMFAGLAAVIVMFMLLSGHFAGSGPLSDLGFGTFSTNLLAPIVPQLSGLVRSAAGWMLDATGGQYEGFSYLGAGLLLLVVAAASRLCVRVAHGWRRHACLIAVLTLFTVFAASNDVYVGQWHALTVPLPPAILDLAGVFRSSGRFIWPVLYCVAAMAIVDTVSLHGRAGAILLVAAAALQLLDATPLRMALAASAAGPAPSPIDLASWRSAISRHVYVRVLPSISCLATRNPPTWNMQASVMIEQLSAVENVTTNTVLADRSSRRCDHEFQLNVPITLMPGELRVYLREYVRFDNLQTSVQTTCRTAPLMTICSNDLPESDFASLLVTFVGIKE